MGRPTFQATMALVKASIAAPRVRMLFVIADCAAFVQFLMDRQLSKHTRVTKSKKVNWKHQPVLSTAQELLKESFKEEEHKIPSAAEMAEAILCRNIRAQRRRGERIRNMNATGQVADKVCPTIEGLKLVL